MIKNLLIGIAFAALWSSAGVASKIGMLSVEPLVLTNIRFFLAMALMLGYAHFIQKKRLPTGKEWQQLAIYGFLNVTVYLGFFFMAMKHISAGVASLTTATNPIIISILTAIWLSRPIKFSETLGLFLGIVGIGIATYPLLQNSYADVQGLLLVSVSIIAYSVGTVYYAAQKWTLPLLVINGWQLLLGGIFMVPFTIFMSDWSKNTYDLRFYGSLFWLVIAVSIGAVQLWLYLLKIDPVKASLWLFLCPIFGFAFANILLNEPITIYTGIGTFCVILGLYLAQKEKFNSAVNK
jgi:probable blue pigment (indigoidine) exporter